MMSLQEKLKKVRDALTGIEDLKVYHYWRSNLPAPFCIWAEDGEDKALQADNGKREQDAQVYVDYYTQQEFDPAFDQIQEALNKTGAFWKWTGTMYEEDTKVIHHTWQVWVN